MKHSFRAPVAVVALSLLAGCSALSGVVDRFRGTPEAQSVQAAAPPVLVPRPAPPAAGATSDRAAAASGMSGGGAVTALPAPAGESRVVSVTPPPLAPRDDPATLPPGTARTVYFDFDSAVVRDDARPAIETHARALAADRTRRLVLEGHTDERGGREYNLSLGQKRAEAVQQALVTLGASAAQLEAVSFGKERPAVNGTGEEVWSRNRRVELKDSR